jgi:hypothetical protein
MTATISTTHMTGLRNAAQLPRLISPLSGIEVVSKLDAAARRGKLPGFHKGGAGPNGGEEVLFHLTDFGHPFESILEARSAPHGSGSALQFSLRLRGRMLWIFIISMVLTVWPGVWLTDSMMRTYFSGYSLGMWGTCAWYLPLTVPFVPLGIWRAIQKSRSSAHASAVELIENVRTFVGSPPPDTTLDPKPAAPATV